MTARLPDADLIDLLDDDPLPATATGRRPATRRSWKVLIVDDDPDVHQATTLALQGLDVDDRPLQFLHAYSAAEARAMLAADAEVAAVFLDVVMETPDAGLRLVREVREELGRLSLRIILRTGQPGFAPEIDTIRHCDINDYRTKSEMTQVRLYTSLAGALRNFGQLQALEEVRRGVEQVLQSGGVLIQHRHPSDYATDALVHLCQLLAVPVRGAACLVEADRLQLLAAPGLAEVPPGSLEALDLPELHGALQRALATRSHDLEQATTLYLPGDGGRGLVLWVPTQPADAMQRHLVALLAAGLAMGLRNVQLVARLADLAFLDPLLGIPNRNRFLTLIDERRAREAGTVMALLDIDDFSGVNQMLGHQVGDDLLQAVAQRLRQTLGAEVVVARVSADMFGLVGPDSQVNAERLGQVMALPFAVQGESLRLTATTGLVRLPSTGQRGVDLLKDANIAMKWAKDRHRGQAAYYSEAMGTGAAERMRLLRGLRQAFEEQHLFVVYQPQVCLDSRRVLGAEALLRWRTEDGQYVPPDRFIPLAEQSGLIVAIGEFVLRTACHQLRRLHQLGHAGLHMAINVSQAQFRAPGFVDTLRAALVDTGVAADCVELEITESMAADELPVVLGLLDAIRATGVRVAIDDFGTGFSSLSVLQRLPVDKLKIDRAFVQDIGPDPRSGNVARMVAELGRGLGMRVIAEGVETEAQCAALLAMGCQDGQGWLFAKGLQAAELETWLARQVAKPA